MNDVVYVGKHLRTYLVAKHSHDNWEFVYCTGGAGEFIIDDATTIRYSSGEVVILPPNVEHTNTSANGFTNIHVRIADATLPFKTPIRIVDDNDKHVLSAFEDIFYYYNNHIEKRQLLLSALSNLIVNYVIAFQHDKQLSKAVEEIKNDIVRNFPDCDYELDEYLKSLPFSYDYLRKLFKSEMGITPHAYLTHIRMQTAQKLLSSLDHEYNVSKVASMCGYDEPLYFSRVFKKHFGCSPIQYQKRHTLNGN